MMMKKTTPLLTTIIIFQINGFAKNPIIPNKGANDPHIRKIDGKAYLSASHDKSIDSKKFIMEDWWLWSSDDLVIWKPESIPKPEQTYIGKPFDGCWATDIVKREGKLLAICKVKAGNSANCFENIGCNLPGMNDKENLCIVFKGKRNQIIQLDSFMLK